jgi:hypothetical protein
MSKNIILVAMYHHHKLLELIKENSTDLIKGFTCSGTVESPNL